MHKLSLLKLGDCLETYMKGFKMSKVVQNSISLGELQKQLQETSKELKLADANMQKAQEQLQVAETAYNAAKRALSSGVTTLLSSTAV